MGKIKLNLVSGAVVEKPLINAFTANNNSYVVLDNEINGSMGLPIILVSKMEKSRLTKIVDQNEWGIVKEYLKNIIAGGQIEFININNEIAADDIYYTQLTLPVPSFDALKNAYKVEEKTLEADNNEIGVLDIDLNDNNSQIPVENTEVVPNNIVEPQPEIVNNSVVTSEDENKPIMDINNEVVTPEEPIINNSEQNNFGVETQEPQLSINSTLLNPIMPEINQNIVEKSPVMNNFEPEISPTPIIDAPIPEAPTITNDIFKEQKEAFMQACENMFDALVQKFEKELENRK